MRITLCILLTLLFNLSFGQELEFSDFKLEESLPDWIAFKTQQIKVEKPLIVTEDTWKHSQFILSWGR